MKEESFFLRETKATVSQRNHSYENRNEKEGGFFGNAKNDQRMDI